MPVYFVFCVLCFVVVCGVSLRNSFVIGMNMCYSITHRTIHIFEKPFCCHHRAITDGLASAQSFVSQLTHIWRIQYMYRAGTQLLLTLSAVFVVWTGLSVPSLASRIPETEPAPRGSPAVDRLLQDGHYQSLQQALHEARYSIRADGQEAWAWNPTHGLTSRFTGHGVDLHIQTPSHNHSCRERQQQPVLAQLCLQPAKRLTPVQRHQNS